MAVVAALVASAQTTVTGVEEEEVLEASLDRKENRTSATTLPAPGDPDAVVRVEKKATQREPVHTKKGSNRRMLGVVKPCERLTTDMVLFAKDSPNIVVA